MGWKWNGIRMENLWEKKSVGYLEEMERKWNGNGMDFFFDESSGNTFCWNGMEMEWKWNGKILVTNFISKMGME